jgi:CRISPR system Cascade subunit CasA
MRIRHFDRSGRMQVADLFGTLAALARDEVADFPALRAHQRQPFHAFCVQVAALALLRAGAKDPPGEADAWREVLLALTPDHPNGEAWRLVVDDWSKPALLQPPGMEPALRQTAKRATTPDELDMLLTARNHDLKGGRMGRAGDDDWLFALVSLQTQEGQMGAGNYGVSRMNGGYGARVALGIRPPGERPGAAFLRDVRRLIALRPEIEEGSEARGPLGLVWLEPWDGAGAIAFADLDPYYVEVCRRVRLVGAEDGVAGAVVANSKAARIAQSFKGVSGDPWAPVLADRTKSWGIGAGGFGYRQMTTLLTPSEIALPPLALADASDGADGLVLHAVAVTRGQGKTEGFHERAIPVPPSAASYFACLSGGLDRVADVAKERREAAGEAQKVLRHALFVLHQGGPERESLRLDDDATAAKVRRFERQLDAAVDACFFNDAFWEEVTFEGPQEDARAHFGRAWRERLRDVARDVLQEAVKTAPRTEMRRLRAVARATGMFEARMRRFVEPDADARSTVRSVKRRGAEDHGGS